MKSILVVMIVVFLVLVGCVIYDFYMGERKMFKVMKGVIFGVFGGVVIGVFMNMLSGKEVVINVFIGVGVGGLVGGVVGVYMD